MTPSQYMFCKFRLGPLPFPIQNLTSETYESIFEHFIGLLGQGISPLQGHYLNRKAQCRKMQIHIHVSSKIQTHDPSVHAKDCMCLRPHSHWDQSNILF